jgi:hypothetical protein
VGRAVAIVGSEDALNPCRGLRSDRLSEFGERGGDPQSGRGVAPAASISTTPPPGGNPQGINAKDHLANGLEAPLKTTAAVAYWYQRDPSLHPAQIAAKIGGSERTVRRTGHLRRRAPTTGRRQTRSQISTAPHASGTRPGTSSVWPLTERSVSVDDPPMIEAPPVGGASMWLSVDQKLFLHLKFPAELVSPLPL